MEWLGMLGVVIGISGLFWLGVHFIKKSQSRDRRYGNPDDWHSAGDHW